MSEISVQEWDLEQQKIRLTCLSLSVEFNRGETNQLGDILEEAQRMYEWVKGKENG